MGGTCYSVRATLLVGLVTDEKALYIHRIDVEAGCGGGGSELGIQCVVLLGPAGRRNVRCCVLSDYACLLARSLLRTSVAGSGWVLSKHRLIS